MLDPHKRSRVVRFVHDLPWNALDKVAVGDGRIHRCDDPRVGERYTDIQ
jgi:hypothetical protein